MASSTAPKKYMSMEQKKYMVDCMVENLDFANNRFQSLRGKELQKQKWCDLSTELNALGGASKIPEQWELSWRDLKQKTKNKWLGIQNRQSGKNGLVKRKRDVLSELEKMVLSVMQKDALDGDGNTQEGGFNEPTLPVYLDSYDEDLEQQDDAYNDNIEFLEMGFASGSGTSFGLTEIPTSSAPSTLAGTTVPTPVHSSNQGTTPRPRPTATPARGRQLGRGQRYSETGIHSMESQIVKYPETIQADKKENMKRKLELQEKMLLIEEKKIAIKQQKVDALIAINDNLNRLCSRN